MAINSDNIDTILDLCTPVRCVNKSITIDLSLELNDQQSISLVVQYIQKP